MKGVIAIAIILLAVVACQSEPVIVEVPADTPTPQPTYTPLPTLEPLPTHTAYPTATAYPTQTLLPTYTPYPTSTPRPTYTPRPTFTPVPTPTATPTPMPTATPRPTNTPTVSLSEKWGVSTIFGVEDAHKDSRAESLRRLIIVGCYAGSNSDRDGETWYTFSKDGEFSESRTFVSVTGFAEPPKGGRCYEMVVRYEGEADYCYSNSIIDPHWLSGDGGRTWFCTGGWSQVSREFYTVDQAAWRLIPKDEWRREYRDIYAK